MTIDLAAVRAHYLAALDSDAALAFSAADVPALLVEINALTDRVRRALALHTERRIYHPNGGYTAVCNGCNDDPPCRTRRALDGPRSDAEVWPRETAR